MCGCAPAIPRPTGSARARALARVAPYDPESALTVARARAGGAGSRRRAQDAARRCCKARACGRRARVCLLMAEIEEAAGDDGAVREWLARAARAPRDRAWVADGIIADRWAPAAPNGALDAFVWRTPDERIAAPPPPLVLHRRRPPPPRRRPPAPAPARLAADARARGAPRRPAASPRRLDAARQRPRRPRPACPSRGRISEIRARMRAAIHASLR